MASFSKRRSSIKDKELWRTIQLIEGLSRTSNLYVTNLIKTSMYTKWDLIPKNLFEQLQYSYNLWFLMVFVILLMPLNFDFLYKWFIFSVFLTLILFTLLKDALNDHWKYKNDEEVNNKFYKVWNGDIITEKKSKDICVGDILCIVENETVPADMLILSIGSKKHICYTDISKINGEKSLRIKRSIKDSQEVLDKLDINLAVSLLTKINGTIKVSPANKNQNFEGSLKLTTNPKASPVTIKNLLQSGTRIVNTNWILGMIIYTGVESTTWAHKRNRFRRLSVSQKLLGKWIRYLWIFAFFLVLFSSLMGTLFYDLKYNDTAIELICNLIILFSNLIPISLFVSLIIIRFFQIFRIQHNYTDIGFHTWNINEDLGQVEYILADKSGTLTKDLLTANVCVVGDDVYINESEETIDSYPYPTTPRGTPRGFECENSYMKKNSSDYNHFLNLRHDLRSTEMFSPIFHFMLNMTICNQTMTKSNGEYFSLSDEDRLLARTSEKAGMQLIRRSNRKISVLYFDKQLDLSVVAFQPPSHETKRIRILIRFPDTDQAILYIRGSRDPMARLLSVDSNKYSNVESITYMKCLSGKKQILFGYRILTAKELNEFKFAYGNAKLSPVNSEGRMNRVFERYEKGMKYLGIVGIEDLVSDETKETMKLLSRAGIKIWLASGDSEESTICAAISSGLAEEHTQMARIRGVTSQMECTRIMRNHIKQLIYHTGESPDNPNKSIMSPKRKYSDEMNNVSNRSELMMFRDEVNGLSPYCDSPVKKSFNMPFQRRSIHPLMSELVPNVVLEDVLKYSFDPDTVSYVLSIDRSGLQFAFNTEESRRYLVALLFAAKTVIFSSITTDQKIKLVRLLKGNFQFKPAIMAIGDGPSDTAMIQESHIGVGIEGNEGPDASLSGCICLRDFSQLKHLLLFEGHYCYTRIASVMFLIIYRDILLVCLLFFYNTSVGFSGISLIDSQYILILDFLLTLLPIMAIGVFDEDISKAEITMHPESYDVGIKKEIFTFKKLTYFAFEGVSHAFILFIFLYFGVSSTINSSGYTENFTYIGILAFIEWYMVSMITIILQVNSFNKYTMASIAISILIAFGYIQGVSDNDENSSFMGAEMINSCPRSYAQILLVPCICFVLSYSARVANINFDPNTIHLMRALANKIYQVAVISRLEKYKDKIHELYRVTDKWKEQKRLDRYDLNKWRLLFISPVRELEYQGEQLRENINQYRALILLFLSRYIIMFIFSLIYYDELGALIFNTIFGLYHLSLFILTWKSLFKKYQKKLLLSVYIVNIAATVIEYYTFDWLTISSVLSLPVIILLGFCTLWFYLVALTIVHFSITIPIIIEKITQSSQISYDNQVLYIIEYIFVYLSVISVTTLISYVIEKSRREEFARIQHDKQEVEKSMSVLNFLLPAFVRKRVKDGARYIAENQGTVSVLFCDICDFEAIISRFTPQELIEFLDGIFRKFDQLCDEFGVTKIETVGKTYMACAGLKDSEPESDPVFASVSHARRAIELGLGMLKAAEEIFINDDTQLKLKIGINSGPVTAGVVGFHKPQFSLVGDTVNTASRMASTLQDSSCIQISNETFELIDSKEGLTFENKTVEVKGKGTMETKLVKEAVLGDKETMTIKKSTLSMEGGRLSTISMSKSSYYFETSHHIISGERRKSLFLETLDLENVDEVFKRSNTPKIEKVRFISFRCKEKLKDQKFREYFISCNFPIVFYGLIIGAIFFAVATALSLARFLINDDKTTPYRSVSLGSLFIEFLLFLLMIKLVKKEKQNIITGWILQWIFAVGMGILMVLTRTEDWTYDNYIEFGKMVLHALYLTHCSESFLKHITVTISIVSILWMLIVLIFMKFNTAEIASLSLILFVIMTYSIYYREKKLRVSYALRKAAHKESKKTENLLTEMMPSHVYFNLKEENTITDSLSDVTILYADIVGYTLWSASKSPEQIVGMLHEFFTRFDRICVEHHVYKVHTIGDCYVAIGFTEDNNRNPAVECLNIMKFAEAMLRVIEDINSEYFTHLCMRIGIHSGNVIGGVAGTKIVRYDIYGRDVLIANKCESNGIPGKIVVSEYAKNLLQKNPQCPYTFDVHKEIVDRNKKITLYVLDEILNL
ncbi:unnamed protein product [Blepharisma stoltei]|uniref:Guanylate cyclase domain-containing protein n=1 Tax=Blepharisma stoltei TaxID=1481888 RepID=A0AAU9K5Z1_9CILI|nr:unnamed protein product [Blepharisma stoltei]